MRETLHASPAQVGSYLLDLWGLPKSVSTAVAQQERPEVDGSKEFSVTTAIYIADHIAALKTPPYQFSLPEWNVDYLKSMECWNSIHAWEQA